MINVFTFEKWQIGVRLPLCLERKGVRKAREAEIFCYFVVGGRRALKWAILAFYCRYMCGFACFHACEGEGGVIRCIQRPTCGISGALNLNIRCVYYRLSSFSFWKVDLLIKKQLDGDVLMQFCLWSFARWLIDIPCGELRLFFFPPFFRRWATVLNLDLAKFVSA